MENRKQPLVSIVATSYNFEKFIPYFIESVLSQTYTCWELIVTDDCSTDQSFSLLKMYANKDKRIRVFQNDKNRHVCHTVNCSLSKATGDYICVMSCDDAFFPEKLSHDVAFMEKNLDIGMLYGQLDQMDENNLFRGTYGYIPPKNFDRHFLLREMFLFGNKLVSPGLFVRKDIIDKVGSFHPLLRMTQDYEYHIRLLFHAQPAYSAESLTRYRRMSDNSNLSSLTETTANTEHNETFFLLNSYLKYIKKYDVLKRIFPEVIKFGPEDDMLIPYYLGRLALQSEQYHVKAFGLQAMYNFMLDKENRTYLEERVNFLPKDFMCLSSENKVYCSFGLVENYPIGKRIRKWAYRLSRYIREKMGNIFRIV